jgi:hypothetical protein
MLRGILIDNVVKVVAMDERLDIVLKSMMLKQTSPEAVYKDLEEIIDSAMLKLSAEVIPLDYIISDKVILTVQGLEFEMKEIIELPLDNDHLRKNEP